MAGTRVALVCAGLWGLLVTTTTGVKSIIPATNRNRSRPHAEPSLEPT